ncbi:hypothetical protein AB0G67_43210 [Streptomyces sp. NPDC021056]|uniref:SCO4402 family protein n=1 Tax=Streptomyces sp. NPDC021056 TaxID=3155012 RepID=UPI0033D3D0AE
MFENLDHVFHTLFDDFCDADEPERYLGVSLRTEEEVALMRELGVALNAAGDEAPVDTDEEYLRAPSWSDVVAVAGRLAQVMVANDLRELAALHNAELSTGPGQEAQGVSAQPRSNAHAHRPTSAAAGSHQCG